MEESLGTYPYVWILLGNTAEMVAIIVVYIILCNFTFCSVND